VIWTRQCSTEISKKNMDKRNRRRPFRKKDKPRTSIKGKGKRKSKINCACDKARPQETTVGGAQWFQESEGDYRPDVLYSHQQASASGKANRKGKKCTEKESLSFLKIWQKKEYYGKKLNGLLRRKKMEEKKWCQVRNRGQKVPRS